MSDATTHLLLPYILAAQAQKHVTHNEALRLLDGLVHLSVLDRDLAAPPASPADGDRYIVGSGATGDWAGWDLNVALWTDGTWLRLPPRTGWRAWVEDEGLLLVYDGAGWVGTTPDALQNLALLGLGTTADASNPFSAKLNAALWTAKTLAEGGTGDLFYTMNKEAAGDDLGLTLQTGFVTKALVGLFGSDRFRLAVSADGSTFFDALSVDNATGIVDQPRLPRFKAYTNYDNYVGVGTWTKIGLNNTDYNDQGAFDAANNHFVAPADGTYPTFSLISVGETKCFSMMVAANFLNVLGSSLVCRASSVTSAVRSSRCLLLRKPLIVRSAYRSPEHNRAVGGATRSKHMDGAAFDIAMANHNPVAFEAAAREVGFLGFGFYPRSGFIHVDLGPARQWGERFPVRATAFAAETPPAREVLADSRTMKGGGAAGVATLGAAGVEVAQQVLAETQSAILPLVSYLDTLRWVFIAVALGGIAVTIYARLDDWKRGQR